MKKGESIDYRWVTFYTLRESMIEELPCSLCNRYFSNSGHKVKISRDDKGTAVLHERCYNKLINESKK